MKQAVMAAGPRRLGGKSDAFKRLTPAQVRIVPASMLINNVVSSAGLWSRLLCVRSVMHPSRQRGGRFLTRVSHQTGGGSGGGAACTRRCVVPHRRHRHPERRVQRRGCGSRGTQEQPSADATAFRHCGAGGSHAIRRHVQVLIAYRILALQRFVVLEGGHCLYAGP